MTIKLLVVSESVPPYITVVRREDPEPDALCGILGVGLGHLFLSVSI
jgi:hypothetical protein